VDNLADEVHKQPQEPVTDDVLANAQGFPGRPHNTSVLIYYVYHVAAIVWVREVLIT